MAILLEDKENYIFHSKLSHFEDKLFHLAPLNKLLFTCQFLCVAKSNTLHEERPDIKDESC